MRRMGCGLVVVLLLAGVAVAADQWVTATAERLAGERISQELGTVADVELHGWPVALRALLDGVPRATVHAEDVRTRRLRIARLDAELTDVRQPADGGELPRARTARFEAVIEERALREALGAPDQILSLRLERGVAVVEAVGFEFEADVVAEGGDIVVEPRDALTTLLTLGSLRIDLSDLTASPSVREVDVRDGRLVVRGVLEGIATRD